MKILFFTKELNPYYCSYLSMLYDLRNHADIKFYGPGWENCEYTRADYKNRKSIDVLKVIDKLYPNDYPDAIIQLGPSSHGLWYWDNGNLSSNIRNFGLAKCLRILIVEDLHNDVAQPSVVSTIQNGDVNLVLKIYDVDNVTKWSNILLSLGVDVEWYPFSFDPALFYDMGLPKEWEVINIGQRTTQNYPIRYSLHEDLCIQTEINYLGGIGVRGQGYAKMINQSRMFATGCSTLKFAVQKMYEVMACNTLLICNTPLDAEKLGFKKGYNYVEIDDYPAQASEANPEKYMKPIKYYLKHPEEACEISQRGHDLVHSRHTHNIRNKDIIQKISKYL